MRLPLVAPSNLSPEQRELYDDMRQGIESNFKGFEAIKSDGALIGPWNPWLNYPKFGGPIWELVKVLSTSPTLPRPVREVAILVTGTHFHSGYELYAHVLIAEARGLPDSKIATIIAGNARRTLRARRWWHTMSLPRSCQAASFLSSSTAKRWQHLARTASRN